MAISRSDPYGSAASSRARGGGDRVDRVGDSLGVVLGNEVARTVDTIKRGPKIARQPLAVADLLEAVGGTPHDLGRNIEGRQAIRDGEGVGGSQRSNLPDEAGRALMPRVRLPMNVDGLGSDPAVVVAESDEAAEHPAEQGVRGVGDDPARSTNRLDTWDRPGVVGHGVDEHEPRTAARVVHRGDLRYPAAEVVADENGALDPEGVEPPDEARGLCGEGDVSAVRTGHRVRVAQHLEREAAGVVHEGDHLAP